MFRLRLIILIAVFFAGIFVSIGFNYYSDLNKQEPAVVQFSGKEIASPSDWIKEHEIERTEKGIFIRIANSTIAGFKDTNSMDPVLDKHQTLLRLCLLNQNLQ